MPSKIKHFIFKLNHSWLPTNDILSDRGLKVNRNCCRCMKEVDGSIFHALWCCPEVIPTWKESGFWSKMKQCLSSNVQTFLQKLSSFLYIYMNSSYLVLYHGNFGM